MVVFKRIILIENNDIYSMRGNSIGVLVVIILIVGGWYYLSSNTANAPVIEIGNGEMTGTFDGVTPVTVAYADDGFSPKDTTVTLGSTVNFVNGSSGRMWVASAMHPTHTAYAETSLSQHCPDITKVAFDQCEGSGPGTSYSFTFNKEGVWKYHDHIDSSKFGSVTVTAAPASSAPTLSN
jgi:plastocyanin